MSYPTVKDLLGLPGARVAKKPEVVILKFEEAILLHIIIMSHPFGFECPVIDVRLTPLCDHGFVRMAPNGRWLPTEEGLRHMRPDLFRNRRRTGLH